MSDDAADRERHTIPALGLTFAANPAWPLESFALPDGEMVYQRLPGEAGAFLIRFGPGQTLDIVLAALGGDKTIKSDERATLTGLPARRVVLTIRESGGGTFRDDVPLRERNPVIVTRVVLVGLTMRETPVVIGYRVYEDEREEYEPALVQMVASIERKE